jgi:hypothetical protein
MTFRLFDHVALSLLLLENAISRVTNGSQVIRKATMGCSILEQANVMVVVRCY